MASCPSRLSARATLAVACLLALVLLAGCSVQYDASVGEGAAGSETDPDDDGLDTPLETELGTDPDDPDTDGDRLPDGWEYHNETDDGAALPGANPLRKDVYIQVVYAEDVDPLTATERENLVDIWRSMNVSNPDGTRGIDLHLDDDPPHGGPVNVSGRLTAVPEDYTDDQYATHVPPVRQCVYHQTLFQRIDHEAVDAGGKGTASGYATMTLGQRSENLSRDRQPGQYNVRERGLTHELLHNLVGEIDATESYHAPTGWLTGEYDDVTGDAWADRYERLSDVVAVQLSTHGFSEVRGTTAAVCA